MLVAASQQHDQLNTLGHKTHSSNRCTPVKKKKKSLLSRILTMKKEKALLKQLRKVMRTLQLVQRNFS